jgi:hypothetical protein
VIAVERAEKNRLKFRRWGLPGCKTTHSLERQPKEKAKKIIETAGRLETAADIRQLTPLLSGVQK